MLGSSLTRKAGGAALSVALLAGMAASAKAATSTATTAAATTVLTRQVIPNLSDYPRLGRSNADQRVQVGVSIASPKAAEEAAFAKALYTPGSADFHHFLTPSERAARFGVDASTVARVSRAVTARGLSVAYAAPDGTYLLLAGNVGQVEQTFAITEEDHRGLDGTTFRANAQPPTVPAGVNAVLGLSSIGMKTSQNVCTVNVCTGTLTAQDLWSVYNQPSSDRGTGQTVAIFGEGDLNQPVNDLRAYEAFKGFRQVPVRRVLVGDDQTDTSGLGEWDLDETAVTGMSPDLAQLSYYFGQDLGDASINATWQAWANDTNGPAIGNSSFGGCEFLQVALGGQVAFDSVLRSLTEEGRTMFNATGDTGGSCAAVIALNGIQNNGVPTVQSPASSPYVTAVGGTVLYTQSRTVVGISQTSMNSPATRAEEFAWTHTGGGTSYFEPAPAWQQDITVIAGRCVAGPDLSASAAGAQCKGVPDVAALSGDVSFNGYETGNGTTGGGTSLSSPLWAGMWARVMAAHPATCAGTGTAGPIGFATPALYPLAKGPQGGNAFFDVTVGSNGQWTALPRSAADPTGWDYVSGLGVPDVGHIMGVLDCGNTTPVATNPNLPLDQTVSPTISCGPNGQLTDPTGDATIVSGITPSNGTINDDALDLTAVDITADSTGITWTNHVVNLAADPTELGFENYFTFGSASYDLLSDNAAPTGPATFTLNSVDPTTGSFTTIIPTLSGSFDAATNTVTITLPYAAFNSAVHPSTALALGSTLTGLNNNADRNLGGLLTPADEASFGACSYVAQ